MGVGSMLLKMFIEYCHLKSLLVGCLGFMVYQPLEFNAKSIFIQIISSISNNSV